METYHVEITETMTRVVEVRAESRQSAVYQVENKYHNGDIVLDSNDFEDYTIKVI